MHSATNMQALYILGFQEAFKLIDENLATELQKLEIYPFIVKEL